MFSNTHTHTETHAANRPHPLTRMHTQEAFDRAAAADAAARPEVAVRLYRTGLEAAREGLALQVRTGAGEGRLHILSYYQTRCKRGRRRPWPMP